MGKDPPKRRQFLEEIFTRQERMALVFLIGVGLSGLILVGWRGRGPWLGSNPSSAPQLVVRINVATVPELTALPGIGPVLARRILEDRQQNGSYLTLADLKRVKGITRRTLEHLEGFVRFD